MYIKQNGCRMAAILFELSEVLLLRATLRDGFDVSNIDLFLLWSGAGLSGLICALRFDCSTQFDTLSDVLGDFFVAVQAIGWSVRRSQSVIVFCAADAAFEQLLVLVRLAAYISLGCPWIGLRLGRRGRSVLAVCGWCVLCSRGSASQQQCACEKYQFIHGVTPPM